MDVLLVDDRKIDRELIKHALLNASTPFDITEVNSAQDGLAKLEQKPFDVVLMDYQMPRMTGMQMLLELKKVPVGKQAIKIIISNNGDEELMLECINAGAQDFLLKQEVTSRQLVRCIKQSHKRFELEKKLHHSYNQVKELAEHDQLTGLCNRYHFEESLKSLLINARGHNGYIAVMLLDLDNFKLINDNFGHATGDELLIELADRVKQQFRESELFARLGGDEFAFVFTGINRVNTVFTIAKRILATLKKPFDVDGHQIFCHASIGISLNIRADIKMEEMLKFADIAMYRAKKEGKHQACLFEDNMENEFLRAFKIENELRASIQQQAFTLSFQPIFHAQSRQITCCEALIRWPQGITTQNPSEFIPVAEQTRLIEPIGRWVIAEAMQHFSSWQASANCQQVKLAINLSPLQIHDLNLPKVIKQQAKKHHIDLTKVVIEITETALLENNESTLETLNAIKGLGCQLALDDFGTGYSSISHLLNYPIDVVKFDKTLLVDALKKNKNKIVLQGLTKMLNAIGISTVAEGVEDAKQAQFCSRIGVEKLQGYLLAKPMPATECIDLLQQQNSTKCVAQY